jgi:YfiH family protein
VSGPARPFQEGGHWVWRDRRGPVEVVFAGRGPGSEREEVLHRIEPGAPPVAWAKQIHSAIPLPARPGHCGEGDALFTREPGLALSVVTADCVPVLLAGPEGVAAVHAGWRGIVGGVVAATIEAAVGRPQEWTAWIGPAIGPCCYEVGEDVAARVTDASHPGVAVPGPGERPHLDLQAAVRHQLEAAGLGEVIAISHCTRCDEEKLWSYRREGRAAGRNLAFIWRRSFD